MNSSVDSSDNSFKKKCLEISSQGEQLLLHPKRVAYWPSQRILLAADIHAGKEHYFGRNGIAIPGGLSETSLSELFSLSTEAGAKRLVILGDFMHAVPTHSEQWLSTLSELLQSHPELEVSIVAGNHDKELGKQRIDGRIQWHKNALYKHPFVFQHEPGSDHRGYVLCGHLHPAWRVKQSRRSSIKTPAFWLSEHKTTGYSCWMNIPCWKFPLSQVHV